MKAEEKMKKNKNYELSHMVRPAESLELYKQKQNILFISEYVEHRRFKVTWARLWVYSNECTDECTVESTCRAYARTGARLCCARTSAQLGWSWCTAWSGRVHGSGLRRTDWLHTG